MSQKSRDPSGKFVLRMEPNLHSKIKAIAVERKESLNSVCLKLINAQLAQEQLQLQSQQPSEIENVLNLSDLSLIKKLLKKIYSEALGLILFGSQSRQEQTKSSDIDLLLVLPTNFNLTRASYRAWDEEIFQHKALDKYSLNLAKLPNDSANLSASLWLEMAIDGIVLIDNNELQISKFLVELRNQLLESHYTKKALAGQNYCLLNLKDFLKRCKSRLRAVQVLYDDSAWADVVRESQEVVELALKALLRFSQIDVPHIHDVSQVLLAEKKSLPITIQNQIEDLAKISRHLRRDRELSYYGSEDLTPSEFYKIEDAAEALKSAQKVLKIVEQGIQETRCSS